MYTLGVKKNRGFWRSLEKYSWGVARRSPLPYTWIGVGIVLSMMGMSLVNVRNSTVGARELQDVIEKAVERGDYFLAEHLYQTEGKQVLGSSSELEDKIYPERVVERRIAELGGRLEEYPGNREIYLILANLYQQLEGTRVDTGVDSYKNKATEYREKARVLDPNHVIFAGE